MIKTLQLQLLLALAPAMTAFAAGAPPESAESRNKATVLSAFERWAKGQPGFFETLLAPDAQWTIAGYGEGTRTFDSRAMFLEEAVAPFARRLRTPIRPTVRGLWADGDEVVVHWTGEAVAVDGQPYRNTYVWIFTMEGAQASQVTAFLDLAPYNDVLRRIR